MTARSARQIFALRIVAKPLQLAAWLLLTVYRNLLLLYLTILSPTSYDTFFLTIEVPPANICMVHYGQTV